MNYCKNLTIVFLILIFFSCGGEKSNKIFGAKVVGEDAKPGSFEKIAPLTANALGERKNLHENGWFVVPSSKKSAKAVAEDGRMSFLTAKSLLFLSLKKRASDYPSNLGKRMGEVNDYFFKNNKSIKNVSDEIYSGTIQLTALEIETSKNLFKESGQKFILGYVYLDKIEKKDRQEIFSAIKNFNNEAGNYMGELNETFSETINRNGDKISTSWKDSFQKSLKAYDESYQKSGERPNTLIALWDIFKGYTIAVKELILAPIGNTAIGSGEVILVNGVALPVAYFVTTAGEVIVTTGLVIYYPVKLGYRVVSPTLESGYLSALGLLSASSTAPTLAGGSGVGVFNQMLVLTGRVGGATAGAAGGTVYETGATATGMVYDVGKGTSKSVFYGLKSGVVLSYTALTVIPTHLVLSVPDGTIFLAWDGPRLVIAVVKGNYKGFENLPTGSIVDLEEAKKAGKVEILTDDQEVVKKVLEKQIEEREKELNKSKREGN